MGMESRGCEFICGQRGMGKTSYIREEILPSETRCIIYDHMAEYLQAPGFSFVNDWESLCDRVSKAGRGFLKVAYIPTEATPEDFARFCRLPFATYGLDLICDEIDQFATAISVPSEFKRLVHFGRHYNSRFIGASRRPADVARAFTSQAYKIICFRQSEPRDIMYLKSFCGDRAEEIQYLEPLHYLSFENQDVTEGCLSFAPEEAEEEGEGEADLRKGEEDERGQDGEDSE